MIRSEVFDKARKMIYPKIPTEKDPQSLDCGPAFLPSGRPGRAPLREAPTALGSDSLV